MLVFALACGGDDDGQPAAVPGTETPRVATATAEPTAASTATAEVLIQTLGATEPLALKPVAPALGLPPELAVYDVSLGAAILRESETYFDTWRETTSPLLYQEGAGIRTYEPQTGWLQLELGEQLESSVASSDGSRVALTIDSRTYLLDLAAGTRQEIETWARPLLFSPDAARLLMTMPDSDGHSPFIVVPFADPAAAVRLPLGVAPNEIAQHSPAWLDADRLLLVSQKDYLVQVYDVSGPTPQIVLEETVESDQVVLSPDGSRIAVQAGGPAADTPDTIVIYDLQPFAEVMRWEDASLGQYLAVAPEIWSPDGGRLLGLLGACSESERLAVLDVATGQETILAELDAPAYRFAFSPDGAWVAFTTHPTSGHVVAGDGSAAPDLIPEEVTSPATPRWTDDARRVAFHAFAGGGYDVCIG